jgi:hypothetical protein
MDYGRKASPDTVSSGSGYYTTLVENLAVPVKPQADSLLAAIISDEKKAVAKKPLSAVLFKQQQLMKFNSDATSSD